MTGADHQAVTQESYFTQLSLQTLYVAASMTDILQSASMTDILHSIFSISGALPFSGWVWVQVQVMLRLYTTLLPPLRQAALQSRPDWAMPAAPDQQEFDAGQDEDMATVRQEAAAVLHVGHRLHSEGQP